MADDTLPRDDESAGEWARRMSEETMYEVWNTTTRNLIWEFDTREAAQEFIAATGHDDFVIVSAGPFDE